MRTWPTFCALGALSLLGACDATQSSEAADVAGAAPASGGSVAVAAAGGTQVGAAGRGNSAGGSSAGGGSAGAPPSGGAAAGAAPCVDPSPSAAANGVNFPFPQSRANHCALPTKLACVGAQNTQVGAAYTRWKATFVTATGAGNGFRVNRGTPDNNDTVSEGIAYGMLFGAYLADKPTFDGLWAYAKVHFNNHGLMNWKINADGNVAGNGQNGATDADEDMAWALLMADKQWGGAYLSDATTLINSIYTNEVEGGSFVLKPGDALGGSSMMNPSYLAPSYYREFAKVTGQAGWLQVVEKSYAILSAAANPQTGLVPDWCTSSGAPTADHSANYSYDACRTPYRIALDYCQNAEPRALAYAHKVVGFFATATPNAIKDGYTLAGVATGKSFGAMSFMAPMSVAATADPDGKFMQFAAQGQGALASKSQSQDGGAYSYYNASWGLLGMLTLSGNFSNLRSF